MSELLNYQKRPQIYVYSVPNQPGLKVGYTERVAKSGSDFDAVNERVSEQLIKTPNPQYKIEHYELAITNTGKYFDDHLVHKWLERFGAKKLAGEWYDTDVETVISVIKGIKAERPEDGQAMRKDFRMRPEQVAAMEQTAEYFQKYIAKGEVPRYLWNAKMRFGKTFSAYQLAKKMGWKNG